MDDSARSVGGGIGDASPSEEIEQEDPDGPGLIELTEDPKTRLEEASDALNCAVQSFIRVSNLLAEHGEKVGKASTPAAWKTSLFQMAQEVAEPAAEFERDASMALDKVVAANSTFRGMIQAIGGMQSDLGRAAELSFAAELQQAADIGEVLDQLDALSIQIADVEKLSAILKKALRPARRGLRLTRDAGRIYEGWRNLGSPKAS
jgi:hypothetical protein